MLHLGLTFILNNKVGWIGMGKDFKGYGVGRNVNKIYLNLKFV